MRKTRKDGSTLASRGQTPLDGIYILIVVFVFALTAIFGYSIYANFNEDVQADDSFHNETKAAAENLDQRMPKTLDYAFFFILLGLWIALIVTSYFIDTHPVFFIVVLMLMLFIFVAAMFLANTYDDVATDPDIATYAEEFPLMNWVFGKFLIIFIFIVMSSLITMFAKSRYG